MHFSVAGSKTFEVAANNFGRLPRFWPDAVFLARPLVSRLDVPFAQEQDIEDYLESLADWANDPDEELRTEYAPGAIMLINPFRAPTVTAISRRITDKRYLDRRGVLANAWSSGKTRANLSYDLTHWLAKTPSWWPDLDFEVEPCNALFYVATH